MVVRVTSEPEVTVLTLIIFAPSSSKILYKPLSDLIHRALTDKDVAIRIVVSSVFSFIDLIVSQKQPKK